MKSCHANYWMVAGLVTGLMAASGSVMALGLGEARVDSYLNQPLEVEIRLVEASAEELDSLTVEPGSPEDYQRVGLDSGVLQARLTATLDRSVSPPVIRLVSEEPINDPVFQVLVNARWASGRVLREYTLFLDPPAVDSRAPGVARHEPAPTEPRAEPEPAEPRPEPDTPDEPPRRPAAEPSPEPRPELEPEPEPEPEPERPAEPGWRSVERGDTLWGIASDWRQDRTLNMSQVMLAFLEANPHAFAGQNVNRLISGVDLEAPSEADVRAIEVRRAEQEIQAQMEAWQSLAGEDLPVVSDAAVAAREPEDEVVEDDDHDLFPDPDDEQLDEPAVDDAPSEEMAQVEPEDDHRLQLVPPEDDAPAEGAADGDPEAEDAEVRRLRAALARTEEELFTFQLENEELNRQVEALRDALDAREQGFAVPDSELAELESRLREARLTAVEESDLVSEDDPDPVEGYFEGLGESLGMVDEEEDEDADAGPVPGMEADDPEAPAEEDDPADEMAPTMAESDDTELRGLGYWLRQPIVWGSALGALLLLLLGSLFLLRRRDEAVETDSAEIGSVRSREEPATVVQPIGSDEPDLVENQRRQIAAEPGNLAAHLVLLRLLADKESPRQFGQALDEMFAQVDDEDAVEWHEAMALARIHVPEHPLVAPDSDRAREHADDTDEDSEADDLLRILGEDDDLEAADSDLELPETDSSDQPESTLFDADGDEAPEDIDFDSLSGFDDQQDSSPDTVRQDSRDDEDEDDFLSGDLDSLPGVDKDSEQTSPGADADWDDDSLEFGLEDFQTDQAADESAEKPRSSEDESDQDALEFDRDLDSIGLEPESDTGTDDPADDSPEGDELSDDLVSIAMGDDDRIGQGSVESTEVSSDDPDLSDDIGDLEGDLDSFREDTAGVEPGRAAEADDTFTLGEDDAEVKLDLARAYVSMGDKEASRTILEEVLEEGTEAQQEAARKLLDEL